jgi:hypothetical protein
MPFTFLLVHCFNYLIDLVPCMGSLPGLFSDCWALSSQRIAKRRARLQDCSPQRVTACRLQGGVPGTACGVLKRKRVERMHGLESSTLEIYNSVSLGSPSLV